MTKVAGLEGSYTEKKRKGEPTGKYTVKFCTGWDELKRAYVEVKRVVDSEKEAIAMMAAVTNYLNVEGGTPDGITAFLDRSKAKSRRPFFMVSNVFDEFMADRRRNPDIAKRTVDTNLTHINRVMPFIGKMDIGSMTPVQAKELLYDLRDIANPLNAGHPVSGTYANKIYATMKQVWDFALQNDYVDSNIFKSNEVKAPQRDTEERVPLTVEEAELVMSRVLKDGMSSFEMGLFLLMVTGMRLSEMLALTWREFDERSGIITVKHSMERDTQVREVTKTKKTRTIPLMPTARKMMVEWRTQQQEWFESKGLRWSREHPVCHNSKGTHILSATYERWWRSNRDRLGVPEGATIHTMRHTFATILIVNCGVDTSTAQALTGHTKPDVLLQIYTHTHQDAKAGAMVKLERFMFPYEGQHDCSHCKFWMAGPSPNSEKGSCWAKSGKTVEVLPSDHICEIGCFEFKAAG